MSKIIHYSVACNTIEDQTHPKCQVSWQGTDEIMVHHILEYNAAIKKVSADQLM